MPIEERLDAAMHDVETEIRTEMIKQGITQAQLADDLNLSRNTISEAVNGYTNPRARKARRKIYKWLGMDESHE